MKPAVISLELWNQLAEASAKVNRATDDLSRSVDQINSVLAHLNIGIETWAIFDTGAIGYSKVDNKWGLSLRKGDEKWRFNDAPRTLRLDAIDYIPDLLQILCQESLDLSGLIDAKMRRMKRIIS